MTALVATAVCLLAIASVTIRAQCNSIRELGLIAALGGALLAFGAPAISHLVGLTR